MSVEPMPSKDPRAVPDLPLDPLGVEVLARHTLIGPIAARPCSGVNDASQA